MPQTDSAGVEEIESDEISSSDWYSEENATFGDRLAGAREAAGMSQRDLAQRIGIKTGTLRRWEDDLAEPRANRLSLLAGMMGVSLSWLLTGKGEGLDAPTEAGVVPGEVTELLDELRRTRGQIDAQLVKLAALEKRLRHALSDLT